MYGQGKDASCKVKNTFLEFSVPEEEQAERKRRTRSDNHDLRNSPLVVASKSPNASPLLQPVDETRQAMPIDELGGAEFEMLEEACEVDEKEEEQMTRKRTDEPAYVVPTTPSPFLHSSFPPQNVPPFGAYGYGNDMGLPPAFDGEGGEMDYSNGELDMTGAFMQGMPFMTPEMFQEQLQCGMFMPPFAWNTQMPQLESQGPVMDGPSSGMLNVEQIEKQLFEQQELRLQEKERAQEDEKAQVAAETAATKEPSTEMVERNESKGKGSKGTSRGAEEAPSKAAWQSDWKTNESQGHWQDWKDHGKGSAWEKPDNAWGGKDDGGRRGKGKGKSKYEERQAREEERAARLAEREEIRAAQRAVNEAAQAAKTKGDAPVAADKGGGTYPKEKIIPCIPYERPEGNEPYTTVMLRNIPNKYTREMLIKQLAVDFNGEFDFMYLPIDFKNKCNVGYGFINFRCQDSCERFIGMFHGVDVRKCLPGLNSKKVVEVTPARVQGLTENVRRLRNSPVMNQLADHPEWMPLLFNEEGVDEPFPMPEQPLPPVKPRGRNREGNRGEA